MIGSIGKVVRTLLTQALLIVFVLAAVTVPAAASTTAVEAAAWSPLGSNGAGDGALNTYAGALAVYNGDLIVGGSFTNAAGIATADFIARWNGSNWSALGSNGSGNGALNGRVNALVVFNGTLYVGGEFTDAAGIATADYIARWNGTNWLTVGSYSGNGALNAKVRALAATDEDLFVGGNFSNVAGNPAANYAARWNGFAWGAIDGSTTAPAKLNGPVHAIAAVTTKVYLGGEFLNAAGIATADRFVRWDGLNWSALGSNGAGDGAFNNVVYAIAVNSGTVYAGGSFQNAAGKAKADFIARWDGTAWFGLGSNGAGDGALNAYVDAIKFYSGNMYVGGDFYNVAGNTAADKIVRWNGSSWSALGSNGAGGGAIGGVVSAIAIRNGYLYVTGGFINGAGSGNAAMDYVASYGPLVSPSLKPDGRIKKGKYGTLVGNNIYNLDGTNQTRTASRSVGTSATFYISIQNDGSVSDRFKVLAGGVNITGYVIRFYRGTTEITSAVTAGTYQTALLSAGSTYTIKAVAAVTSLAAIGSANSRLVIITSVTDDTKKDAVKFVIKRA